MQIDSVAGTPSIAPDGVSGTTVATPDVFGTDFGTVLIACFFSGIGNVATAAARLGNFPSGFPMAKVSSHCEIQPRLLSMLRDRHPGSLCFGDINNVLDHSAVLVACNAAIAVFAFNCEPYSIQGNAKGDKDPRADSIIWIFDYATRFKPKIIVLENVKGFLIWRCAGKHHPEDGSITGPAFENLSLRLQRAGYHFQWVILHPWQFKVGHSRARLFMIATRLDVFHAVGEVNVDAPGASQAPAPQGPSAMADGLPVLVTHTPIAELFAESDDFYVKIAPASKLIALAQPCDYCDFKPHWAGNFRDENGDLERVWASSGLSPSTSFKLSRGRISSHHFLYKGDIVAITTLGKAALLQVPFESLPCLYGGSLGPGDSAACLDHDLCNKVLGSCIDSESLQFILKAAVLHVNSEVVRAMSNLQVATARVSFPSAYRLPSAPPTAALASVTIPELAAFVTTASAVPGLAFDTPDNDNPPPALDEALLQASVKVELERWEAKIARLDDAYDSSRNWGACSFDFGEHTFCDVHEDDMQDLCHTFPNHFECPPQPEANVLANRASVAFVLNCFCRPKGKLSDRMALQSKAIRVVLRKYRDQVELHAASDTTTLVSPSLARWHAGQADALADGVDATPAGALRDAQLARLHGSPLQAARSALLPNTVPATGRHPWSGMTPPERCSHRAYFDTETGQTNLDFASVGLYSSLLYTAAGSPPRQASNNDGTLYRQMACVPTFTIHHDPARQERPGVGPTSDAFATVYARSWADQSQAMQESNAKLFSMPYSSVYQNHSDHVRFDCLPGNGGYLPASFDTRDFNGIANFDDTSDFSNKYPDVLFVWLPSRTHSRDAREIPRMAPTSQYKGSIKERVTPKSNSYAACEILGGNVAATTKIILRDRPAMVVLGMLASLWSVSPLNDGVKLSVAMCRHPRLGARTPAAMQHLPLDIWTRVFSFVDSSDDIYPAIANAFCNLGYKQLQLEAFNGIKFVVLAADEVALPMGFPSYFNSVLVPSPRLRPACKHSASIPGVDDALRLSAFTSIIDNVRAFLRPQSSYRVNALTDVWPLEHQALYKKLMDYELKRALHLVNGGDPAAFPPHETVVFDQCHLHPDARGIYWDLRDYYRVLNENGQDYPWLIVPLFSKEVRPGKLNHNAIRTLTKRHAGTSAYGDLETPDGLKFGVNNNAAIATHGYARGNWAKSYEFFDIGDADIRTYADRGWIRFSDQVCFIPLSIVPQNSVVKPGKDPKLIRRRVIDLTYDGTRAKEAQLTPSGERYSNLSLNARSNIEDQAPLVFANFDQFERQVMTLAQSGLPVVIFKCDGDAWYKQFPRRLQEINDGVTSWPDFSGDEPVMRLFYDLTLQFGDSCAAHRTYRATYMIIWIFLQDCADRPAVSEQVRGWQKLQLDLLARGDINRTDLSYVNAEGFIDDFMFACLRGEEYRLLASFLALMQVLGFDVSAKKLLAEAAPGFVKPILGFIMNTKDKTASLPEGWSRTFVSEIDAVLNGSRAVNLKCVQKLGGKAIRVVTLFRAVRGFCNGIFLAVRHHKQGSAQARRAVDSGIQQCYVTPFVDDLRLLRELLLLAPTRKLMLEPAKISTVSSGVDCTDSDASTSWGFGACVIVGSKIYYMYDEWTDDERETFDIADFEGIALDFAYRYFPRVVPEAFARKRFVGRVDNENVEYAVRHSSTKKGVLSLVIKNLMSSQVQHSFSFTVSRVSSADNILADALSRGDLDVFIGLAQDLQLTPVRVILSPSQRSTQCYADVKADYSS